MKRVLLLSLLGNLGNALKCFVSKCMHRLENVFNTIDKETELAIARG